MIVCIVGGLYVFSVNFLVYQKVKGSCMKISEVVVFINISIKIFCFYENLGLLLLFVCIVLGYCNYGFEIVDWLWFIYWG